MTTIVIEDNSPQARQLLDYVKSYSFVTVIEEPKKNFKEAAEECNAVSVDVFFDELDNRIKNHFQNA